jgi:hypothetical protein
MNIVRFKVVSECIGIRRSSIAYFKLEDNKTYDVSSFDHPLNSLKTITINENKIKFLDKDEDNDIIPFKLKAYSLGNEIEETCYLETKFIELNESNIDYVKKNFGEIFDESKGEYEFMYGLYMHLNNKETEAQEAFKDSFDKGFKLASRYFNN